MTQVRTIVVLSSIIVGVVGVVGVALLTASCKDSGNSAASGPDGGPDLKIICKMNSQCWICPSNEALKKCIINPVSSGCKLSSAGDCS